MFPTDLSSQIKLLTARSQLITKQAWFGYSSLHYMFASKRKLQTGSKKIYNFEMNVCFLIKPFFSSFAFRDRKQIVLNFQARD